MIQRKLVFSPF